MIYIWQARFQSLLNGLRYEKPMRVALPFMVLFGLLPLGWMVADLSPWQVLGGSWLLVVLLALLSIRTSLNSTSTQLLLLLPFTPRTLCYTVLGELILEQSWPLLTLSGGSLLWLASRHMNICWLLLLSAGMLLAPVCALLGLLLAHSLASGALWRRLCSLMALVSGLLFMSIAKLLTPQPEALLLLLCCLLALLLGPLAPLIGKLYASVFYQQQASRRHRQAVPGMRPLLAWLERKNNPESAFLFKALLNQSRNPFTWIRTGIMVLLVALFPLVYPYVQGYASKSVVATLYALAVTLFHVLEPGTCALGGEGNRLTLLLTAPLKPAHLLRARLLVFLLLIVGEGLFIGALLGWWLHLTAQEYASMFTTVCLLLSGCTTLLVCGSAHDADLNQAAETLAERLLQEEGPFTPLRMLLLGSCLGYAFGSGVLLWTLPFWYALPLLSVLTGTLFLLSWRFGLGGLTRLVKPH
ncbi:hypothetical protein EI42_02823 [Thermosporothrix hazakensis]|jgi:hypothetical protein|uniref:Uncharacterized protein n=1 Tax=Thermosporothrix hazakensis TaxID=644383 RepID=A0A326UKT8_THEHA|nr:hypothetical protein [Thermosporothrix hazakensis]PZW29527.1 hypothetical protein EI42_02823 [Thermosporothrix hazakensis]GCE45758.1 hypothetical protein KTH_06270 [Thermosporothrix hazakensis]